jgi:multidrug transporter EmrE-like cation transporter
MSDALLALVGTPEGNRVAIALALMAAFLHAVFGALQKGRHDPWLTRAAIDASYGIIAAPFALFVVPWPEPHMWAVFAGAIGLHSAYKIVQAMTYDRAPFTVVYPVVRGTGPFFTVIGAGIVFGEQFAPLQWVGLLMLVGGIFGFSAYNLARVPVGQTLWPAMGLALITGCFVAAYTTYDAWGIRATADPFTFLAWFFMLDGIFIPLVTQRHWRSMARERMLPLLGRGVIGAFVAYFSFGGVMLATRIDRVGEAAALRETSTVFAALIGWWLLGEKVGPVQVALMAMIAAGAVVMEMAG